VDSARVTTQWDQEDLKSNTSNQQQQVKHDDGSYLEEKRKEKEEKRRLQIISEIPKKDPANPYEYDEGIVPDAGRREAIYL
jgi:hypothetical protein